MRYFAYDEYVMGCDSAGERLYCYQTIVMTEEDVINYQRELTPNIPQEGLLEAFIAENYAFEVIGLPTFLEAGGNE